VEKREITEIKIIIVSFVFIIMVGLCVYIHALRCENESLNKSFHFAFDLLEKEQRENKEIKERQFEIKNQQIAYYKNKTMEKK